MITTEMVWQLLLEERPSNHLPQLDFVQQEFLIGDIILPDPVFV